MRRKFLSVVLCVCMMLTMAPFAFAEEDGTPTISDGGGSGSSNAVAQIERTRTSYDTLQEAIDDAQTGDTITLQKSISANEIGSKKQLQFNKASMSLTLDLNDNVMTAEAGEAISINAANIDLTVKNGTIKNFADGNYSDGLYAYKESNNLTLKFENVQLESRTQGLAVQGLTSNSNVTILNSKITSSQELGIYYPPKSGTLTITNSEVTGATGVVIKGSNLVVNGSQTIISGTGPNTDPETYYTGATDGSSQLTETGDAIYIESGYNDRDISVTISDGHFTSTHAQAVRMFIKNGEETSVKREVSLIGGTFSSDVSRYLTNDYIQNENGTVEALNESNAVAKIGETYYKTLANAVVAAKDNDTVTLLKSYQIDKYISIKTPIILDLGGNTLTSATSGFDVYKNFTLKNGTLKTNTWGVWVQNENVNFTLASDATINADCNTTLTNAPAIIVVQNASADISGTATAQHNFAVSGNGTSGWGGVTINVNPGANISTTTDAPALYFPNTTSLNITGGTITGGTGVYVKSGTISISDGTIIGNGPKADYEFDDNGANSTGDALVVETCNYPGGAPTASVTGGNFKSVNANAIGSYAGNGETTPITGFISGGYFTTDPTPYCGKDADGKQLVGIPSTDSNYPFTVGTLAAANVDVAPANPQVKVDNTIPDNVKETATAAANAAADTSATGLDAIGGSEATKVTPEEVTQATTKLSDSGVNTTSQTVTLYVQPYLDITVTGAEVSNTTAEGSTPTTTSLSLEITPMIKKVASTAENAGGIKTEGEGKNAVQIGDAQKVLNVNTPVTIKLALPTGFAQVSDKLSIKHTKENGSIEYYTGIVSTEGTAPDTKTYVTFTTNGFSPFVIYAASANVASIGEGENQKVYPTLQAAIDAVQNNETITLLKDTNENVTVSKAIKFTLAGKDQLQGSIAAGSRYSMTTSDTTSGNTEYTFTHVGGGSSSSISAPTTYAVNVNAATNGAVAADKKTASKGTTVTVTASPSKGYVVDAVKVVDKDGKDVAVTEKDGKYVFTMPASAVTVTGSFKAETPAPAALPFTDVKSGNWFYDAVKYAYAQGLMTGTSATTFAPNGTMNRAMIVTVLYRLEKSPAVTGASKFTDVPAGQWYSDAVAWAAANKIVNGYDETTFGPMNAVTREQMAAILFRYEQVKGLENVTLEENLNRFPDQNKISAYAIPALQWAVGQKIINGNADGTLDPTGTATRAQVAQIFTNLLNQ